MTWLLLSGTGWVAIARQSSEGCPRDPLDSPPSSCCRMGWMQGLYCLLQLICSSQGWSFGLSQSQHIPAQPPVFVYVRTYSHSCSHLPEEGLRLKAEPGCLCGVVCWGRTAAHNCSKLVCTKKLAHCSLGAASEQPSPCCQHLESIGRAEITSQSLFSSEAQ